MNDSHGALPLKGQLFVISAPSGAGKTSLVKALIRETFDVSVAVSHTTRTQRLDETDGVNYYFVDRRTFEAMVENGDFLEWAVVFGNLYGTSKAEADRELNKGKHLVLEIDWQGAQQIRRTVKGTQSIFIFPPSLEALRERLLGRAQDDEATVQHRMDAAFQEISHYDEFDYWLVNDVFNEALDHLQKIIAGEGEEFRKQNQHQRLKPIIESLVSGSQTATLASEERS